RYGSTISVMPRMSQWLKAISRIRHLMSTLWLALLGGRHKHSTLGAADYLKITSVAARPRAVKYGSPICYLPKRSGNTPPVAVAWVPSTLGADRPHAMRRVA